MGIFKIATRMLARKKVSSSLIEMISNIFIARKPDVVEVAGPQALPHDLVVEMSGQIAAGMWRLLTQNVSVLPVLTLEQWQVLFDILSISAASGGYASIKAFESMAWLLHEPRLRAEVPVFCVVAIKPLLRNTRAPVSVSVGAVQLLSHLHMRLEVLVKDDEEDTDTGDDNSDTPVLWESCWAPILRALADGVADPRAQVRDAAVDALCSAILDRHILAVPASVMTKILVDIVIPTVRLLGEAMLESSGTSDAILRESTHGEEVLRDVLKEDSEKRSRRSPSKAGAEDEAAFSGSNHDRDEPEGVLNRVLRNVTPTRELEVGPAMECLSALTKAFCQQVKKLSSLPSFEALWSSILELFSFFLLATEHGGVFDKVSPSRSPEISFTIDLCYEHLRNVLQAVGAGGYLGPNHRPRWAVTYDKVLLLSRGSKVFIEIFEDCRRDAPPVLKTLK